MGIIAYRVKCPNNYSTTAFQKNVCVSLFYQFLTNHNCKNKIKIGDLYLKSSRSERHPNPETDPVPLRRTGKIAVKGEKWN